MELLARTTDRPSLGGGAILGRRAHLCQEVVVLVTLLPRRSITLALPQDVPQVDQKLLRPLLLDPPGAGPDPGAPSTSRGNGPTPV